MTDLPKKLNASKDIHLYWILLYSYDHDSIPKEMDDSSIYIFPFSYYTQYSNRAIWVFHSERQLDLGTDEDLDLILKKFRISNVKSMSELNINFNTNIICLEIDNNNHKRYKRHSHLLFYTSKHSPSYFINKSEYLDQEDCYSVVPQNTDLNSKIKIHLSHLGIISTKIVLNKIFSFLFSELFQTLLSFNTNNPKTICDVETDSKVKEYFENNSCSIQSLLESLGTKKQLKDENEDSENESGYDTDDSNISWYSYCKKYGIPSQEKMIE